MNKQSQPVPPLGVKPRDIWLRHRVSDLSRAICEYTNSVADMGVSGAEMVRRMERVYAWSIELAEVMDIIRKDLAPPAPMFRETVPTFIQT